MPDGIRSPIAERTDTAVLADIVRSVQHPLRDASDLDPLLDRIGNARYVLLGEASHGTSEYYVWRGWLTRRLIREKGFSFVAVEGDWPDCYAINRYVKGYPDSGNSARDVLGAFRRWPTWMWANWEIVALTDWLKKHNDSLPNEQKVGFYGLDVYSLWESMYAIMDYLQKVDLEAAKTAKRAIQCFEPYGEAPEEYAESLLFVPTTCEADVIQLLAEIHSRMNRYPGDREAAFSAEQNALVAVDAERYYRTMIRADAQSWNIRDCHMADTLDRLMDFHGPQAKGIVWEHNTHVGDARETDMTLAGEVNIGELIRERHGRDDAVLVGFSGYQGSVIAGTEWGAQMEEMPVPPGMPGSWEATLHEASAENKLLIMRDLQKSEDAQRRRGQRAIGVVYRPQYERYGNYVPTVLPRRYDALLSLDRTQALHPLHILPVERREPPETYPWGL